MKHGCVTSRILDLIRGFIQNCEVSNAQAPLYYVALWCLCWSKCRSAVFPDLLRLSILPNEETLPQLHASFVGDADCEQGGQLGNKGIFRNGNSVYFVKDIHFPEVLATFCHIFFPFFEIPILSNCPQGETNSAFRSCLSYVSGSSVKE